MLRTPVLLLALLLASGRVMGQQTHPDRLPLAEQFRMHYFIDDSIVAALPGYVDFASDFPCNVVVYLMNPRTWGDSARALFRNALPADTSELSRSHCAGRPEVRVRASRYTRAQLTAFANRITTVLQEPGLKVRGSIRVTPETLIVGAHNQAALQRARSRLTRETALPQAMLSYRVWKPEEVDGPVTPPRAAYLAVLDTIAAAPSEPSRPFVVDPTSLPATVGEDDLRQRGLRSRAPSDSCGTPTVVSFQPPRQFVNGLYVFSLAWRANDYSYDVDCSSGTCRVTNAAQLPGDKISTGCASAEFGVDDRNATTVMAGISNHGRNGGEPYVTAGDRAYLIGTQDGDFPDLGGHVPGEMGGLWVHPIKLLDGLWATVRDSAASQEVSLSKAAEFVNYPYGNRFKYGRVLDSLEIDRFQFSPDGQPGVIVQYSFSNTAGRPRELRFQLLVKTDLLPVWFSEKMGITDAPDTVTWQPATRRFLARDTRHRWFAVWGATTSAGAERVPNPPSLSTNGMGASAVSSYTISLAPHESSTLTFVFAGSTRSSAAAGNTFAYLARHHAGLLDRKQAHYASVINRARIRIPDHRLQEVYNWVKVDAEWLVRDVPGMGRALGGGFMEYPWWFGTETYSLQALLAAGNADLAKQTLRLLQSQSAKANGNGRIVHEVTTNGAVSNPGNNQETAQFILTVGKVIQWTGDLSFATEMYPAMKQGLHWLLADMDQNRNLFPEGYGITEILGLNAELIDVAVYTQQALLATAEVAGLLGEKANAARYRRLASELERRINDRFWLEEEGSYADFYGSRAQAISTAEGAAKQIGLKGNDKLTTRDKELIAQYQRLKAKFAAMPDTTKGWITNKNWVVATPMEMGIAPRTRAIQVLDRIRKHDLGEYGPFLSAVDRQAMMTISTGVLAVSEASYGRTDDALWYMDKIVQTFNRKLPGSISEMMPDYGCFVIAWTMYGIVVPLVQHIFGIQPDAVHKTVVFDPHLPKGWEDMSIEDVAVGTNLVSFARAKTARGIEYNIEAKQDGWSFVLKGDLPPGAKYYVNGSPVPFTSSGIRISGMTNRVLVVP